MARRVSMGWRAVPVGNAGRRMAYALMALAAAWILAGPAQSDEAGYHSRFEALCGRCHGHSGPFARDRLAIVDGQLVGRATGRRVEGFLRRHPGGLSAADIALFRDVMRRQVEAGGVFQDRCAICHGQAVELAAANLAIFESELRIRYSGEAVRDYLTGHGRLDDREIEIVHQALYEITKGR